MSKKLYTLMCPNCKRTYQYIRVAKICPNCGNVAVLPVLDDEQCKEILESDGSKPLPDANIKRDYKMKDRAPEDGGPVM